MSWMLAETSRADALAARLESVGAKLPERRVTTRELMASTRHHTRIDLERLTCPGAAGDAMLATGEPIALFEGVFW
jgi:hypothetical protein